VVVTCHSLFLNVETVFHSTASLDFNPDRKLSDGISVGDVRIRLAEDNRSTSHLQVLVGPNVSDALGLFAS
jgi:hypothetical protein